MADIRFTEPAEYDLVDIEHYIHVDLGNPQAAVRIIDGIVSRIEKMQTFPKENPLVNDELLQSVGLRITWFDNYNIFYYFDESEDIVYVIRILYNKADWKNILKVR